MFWLNFCAHFKIRILCPASAFHLARALIHSLQIVGAHSLFRCAHAVAAHYPLDPWQEIDDPRVHSGQIGASTPAAKGHKTDDLHAAGVALDVQRSAAVALYIEHVLYIEILAHFKALLTLHASRWPSWKPAQIMFAVNRFSPYSDWRHCSSDQTGITNERSTVDVGSASPIRPQPTTSDMAPS